MSCYIHLILSFCWFLNVLTTSQTNGSSIDEIDLTACEQSKGCYRNPPNCSPASKCSQIVTWTVSPDDPSAVRFEMATVLTYMKHGEMRPVHHLAFALSPEFNSIMANSSVLVCSIVQATSTIEAYFAHTADSDCQPLPADQYQLGLQMIRSELDSTFLTCVIDQKIIPSPKITPGLVYPLHKFYYPSLSAGGSDENGVLGKHVFKSKQPAVIRATDFTSQTSIDPSLCGIVYGCLLNPPDCKSMDECQQIVAWNMQRLTNHVRFQMATNRTQGYVSFCLADSPDEEGFMGNGSVVSCVMNSTGSQIIAYHSHNQKGVKGFESIITENASLKLLLTSATASHFMCVFDHSIHPDKAVQDVVFDLSLPWFPSWAAGPSKNGYLGYHRSNKLGYNERITCTTSLGFTDAGSEVSSAPSTEVTAGIQTSAPPQTHKPTEGPTIDLEKCDKTKGCYRNPPNCSPASKCSQIVTWTVSPDDPSAVRFEMATVLTYMKHGEMRPVHHLAFALSPEYKSIMANASILVCTIVQATSSIKAYFAHTSDRDCKPLPSDQYQLGLQMIRSELDSTFLTCVIDQKIIPSPKITTGLVYPLHHFYYPSISAGGSDENGVLGKHVFKSKQPAVIRATDFTSQTSIDPSLCGIVYGCLLNPPDCKSMDECQQIVAWNIQSLTNHVRFQMSTHGTLEYVSLGLADSADKAGFMGNSSAVSCVMNSTSSQVIVYHSHIQRGQKGFESVITEDANLIKPLLTLATSNYYLCVFDQVVHPEKAVQNAVFDLSLPWFPSWAAGPAKNGLLSYHRTNKLGYSERITCTEPFSPIVQPEVARVNWFKFFHAVFMMAGWMICIPCLIVLPRYYRLYWFKPKVYGNAFWFFVHRTLTQIGIVFVITGFVLIVVHNRFELDGMGPGKTADVHLYFGIISIAILMLNAVTSVLRGKPATKNRKYFKLLHGFGGAIGFVLAAITLISGGVMMYTDLESTAIYPITIWAGLHGCFEIVLPGINYWARAMRKKAQVESIEMGKKSSENANPDAKKQRQAVGKIFKAVFLAYFLVATALTAISSVLIYMAF